MNYQFFSIIVICAIASQIHLSDGLQLEKESAKLMNLTFEGLYQYPGQYLVFYFPNFYKEIDFTWWSENVMVSLLCLKEKSLSYSSEIQNPRINQTTSKDGIGVYFQVQFSDIDNCTKTTYLDKMNIDNLNVGLSFRSSIDQKIEYYRAIFKQIIKTDTMGCAWIPVVTQSNFEICNFECLQNRTSIQMNTPSSLKFCLNQYCNETQEELKLYNNQEIFLIQEIIYDSIMNANIWYGYLYFVSDDGVSLPADFVSKPIYQEGKVIYHINITHAWNNFIITSIAQLKNENSSLTIGGQTKPIDCVLNADENCLSCNQICEMNCGYAPSICRCQQNLCITSDWPNIGFILTVIALFL